MKRKIFLITILTLSMASYAQAELLVQPRAGGPIPGLTANELAYFNAGQEVFLEEDSVSGTEPGAEGVGLGPRFNMTSCGGCHAQPATGGSSPVINPQIAAAIRFGARNIIPPFIRINGPVREARFINVLGARPPKPDGGVHNLFVITGRADAGTCNITQPDFNSALQQNNVIFRIPTPIFGDGLIEAIPDATIIANMNANIPTKRALGIIGRLNRRSIDKANGEVENRSGNDGTITRFGWKAQNKSLLLFAGEAYNVEQGVTNEMFQNKRDETPGCVFNGIPEDHTIFNATEPIAAMSDLVLFTQFMRFLAPPTPLPLTPAAQQGQNLFNSIGCGLCHTPAMVTALSSTSALSNQIVNLYSDLLLHDMGKNLADGIRQGLAGPQDFRTAPLWGVGQRLFFMHDGRTNTLAAAINAHDGPGSEASKVIKAFNRLTPNDQGNVIAFLQSL